MNDDTSSESRTIDALETDQTIDNDALLTSKHHDLEDHIELLRELDKHRRDSAELRNYGIHLLEQWSKTSRATGNSDPNIDHIFPGDDLAIDSGAVETLYKYSKEPSIGLRRLYKKHLQRVKHKFDRLQQSINKATIQRHKRCAQISHLLFLFETDPAPVLLASGILQVLLATTSPAYSKAALLCYYWIARELFTADAPDWNMGGARAAPGGRVSAYVTAHCVDAVLAFVKAQENSARFIDTLRVFKKQVYLLEHTEGLPYDWKILEKKRLELSCYVTLHRYSGTLALQFVKPEPDEDVTTYVDSVLGKLTETLRHTARAIKNAIDAIAKYRKIETGLTNIPNCKDQEQRNIRSQFAHERVRLALSEGQEQAEQAATNFGSLADPINDPCTWKLLEETSLTLTTFSEEVRKILLPTEQYLESVLDRELAAASLGSGSTWNPAEIAFAASSLLALKKGRFDDKALRHAVKHLSRDISDRGLFPAGRPLHTFQKQLLYVYPGELIRAYSELLRYTKVAQFDPGLVKKLLAFFETTRVNRIGGGKDDIKRGGWFMEFDRQPERFSPAATIVAVQTLASINQMLDDRINNVILEHFSVKRPEKDLDLDLDELFYPDYGLVSFLQDADIDEPRCTAGQAIFGKGEWPETFRREESVGLALQQMRAHVAKVPVTSGDLPFSVVLHGPPGTGKKTTLVEALARTCDVPLVEVTPSDLVVGGTEAVEKRSRAVFEALSLLTRVVILFDEFDPVLWKRNPEDPTPRTVFSFLTPGMLPKLKTLHRWAKKRSFVYVLVTNLIGSLDGAAVREGRFDRKIGIYPPDVLSRLGRLLTQLYALKCRDEIPQEKIQFPNDMSRRVLSIVKKTAGGSMEQLGKPGWFTAPKAFKKSIENGTMDDHIAESVKVGTPFNEVLHECLGRTDKTDNQMKAVNREAHLDTVIGNGKLAILEYVQWWWISVWDDKIGKTTSALTCPDDALFDRAVMGRPSTEDVENLRKALIKWRKAESEVNLDVIRDVINKLLDARSGTGAN